MPSRALGNFMTRQEDIDRLLTAHGAFIRYSRAQSQSARAGSGLAGFAAVARELGSPPHPGRPPKIDAIHRAAIVLMSAHLEGFIEDLYEESAEVLLSGKTRDPAVLVEDARDAFRNPSTQPIEKLFRTLGLPDILAGISWRASNNESVRRRLNAFVRLRNNIAHGKETEADEDRVIVHKSTVNYYKNFTKLFAENLEAKVSQEIQSLTHTPPW
jgi:hypothetical protein